jgi:hypothetical protein
MGGVQCSPLACPVGERAGQPTRRLQDKAHLQEVGEDNEHCIPRSAYHLRKVQEHGEVVGVLRLSAKVATPL